MALKPCRECGKQVSTEATACPNCGVPKPTRAPRAARPRSRPSERKIAAHLEANRRKSRIIVGALGATIATILLIVAFAPSESPDVAPPPARPVDPSHAELVARARARLEAEGSATGSNSRRLRYLHQDEFRKEHPGDFVSAAFYGNLRVGMSEALVLWAWGLPLDRNRTTTAYGTREQWVYGEGRYAYLEEGVLTSFQD